MVSTIEKPTLVLGASPKADRYSFLATEKLHRYGHPVFPLGIKSGKINDLDIITDRSLIPEVHTITLYLNPTNQLPWYDYIIAKQSKRVIFNPGTWNPELVSLLEKSGVEIVDGCTLVMLSSNQY
jgi:predicted CoA-binding protein